MTFLKKSEANNFGNSFLSFQKKSKGLTEKRANFKNDNVQWRHLRAQMDTALTLWWQLIVNGDVLDWVEVFKYPGCMLSQDDDAARAI